MLGAARALSSRGHHVYFSTFEHMRGFVESSSPGVIFLSLGRSPLGEGGGDGEIELHRKISDPKVDGGLEWGRHEAAGERLSPQTLIITK